MPKVIKCSLLLLCAIILNVVMLSVKYLYAGLEPTRVQPLLGLHSKGMLAITNALAYFISVLLMSEYNEALSLTK